MNSDIQQPGSFRRYSERLSPCLISTEYPRLAKRNWFFRNTKTAKQKGISRLSRLSPIQTRSGHNTCKPAPAYAPQSPPRTCAVTVRPTFRYPPRHAPHADHALSRIQIERLLHDAQAFTAYRLPVSRTVARCRRHVCQQRAWIQLRSTSDITPVTFPMPASCVPVFARMPVHSSGIVSEGQPTFRIDAPRHTARLGKGRCPFEPGKPKGRESGEARQARPHCRCCCASVPGGA